MVIPNGFVDIKDKLPSRGNWVVCQLAPRGWETLKIPEDAELYPGIASNDIHWLTWQGRRREFADGEKVIAWAPRQ